jgi:hypothetical protein
LALAPDLSAQQGPEVAPASPFVLGRRLRLVVPLFGTRDVVGAVDSLIGDVVVMDTTTPREQRGLFGGGAIPVEDFRRVRVRVGDIRSVYASRGIQRTGAAVRYGIYGALGGALLFGVSGAPQFNPTFGDVVQAAGPGAVVGGVIGAAIGLLSGRERWTLIPGPYTLDSPPVGRRPDD